MGGIHWHRVQRVSKKGNPSVVSSGALDVTRVDAIKCASCYTIVLRAWTTIQAIIFVNNYCKWVDKMKQTV